MDFIRSKRALLVPELNFSGQFGRMIEHRYYRELDERNIHVYQYKKEQGVPLKVREVYDATMDMIDQERELWGREHGDLARIFNTARRLLGSRSDWGKGGSCERG